MALFLAIGLLVSGIVLTLATKWGSDKKHIWANEIMVEMILVPLICGLLSSGVLVFVYNT